MKLIRALLLTLAVLLPTSWTLAHAEGTGGSGGETKKGKKKSKKKGGSGGSTDTGDTKAE